MLRWFSTRKIRSKAATRNTVKDLVAATRTSYQGPLEVGEDLMSFDVGETVTMKRLMPQV